jgi:hypothetical protein
VENPDLKSAVGLVLRPESAFEVIPITVALSDLRFMSCDGCLTEIVQDSNS